MTKSNGQSHTSEQPAEVTPPAGQPIRWHQPLVALAVYAAVTLAFFASVLSRLGGAQLGDGGDGPQFLWNAWWMQQSLLCGDNPYFCNLVFAPEGVPLIWHSLVPLQSTIIALLNHWLPMALAYNLVAMVAFPLAGMSMYALARHLVGNHPASIVGGLVLMLSPFLTSKTLGHLNLLFAGLLPLYLLCLLKATQPQAPGVSKRWSAALLMVSVLILFSDVVTTVFAANLTAFVFVWRALVTRQWRRTALRLFKALLPTLVMGALYAGMVAFYAVRYELYPSVRGGLGYCPEPLCYLLPFTRTSAWSGLVQRWAFETTEGIEPACYLGWLVFPLSLAGLIVCQRRQRMRFCLVVMLVFIMLSLGPKLQCNRNVVRLGPLPIYLPYAIWRYVPVLGAVGQSGRYMLIAYLMMGLGLAGLCAAARRRYGRRRGGVVAALCAAAVCADYAFRPLATDLPPVAKLSSSAGRVLDPRLHTSLPMYYQMFHHRPLVGGYLSRTPEPAIKRYRQSPGLAWFFEPDGKPPPDPEMVLAALQAYGVTNVQTGVGDRWATAMDALGYQRFYEDAYTITFRVPDAMPP